MLGSVLSCAALLVVAAMPAASSPLEKRKANGELASRQSVGGVCGENESDPSACTTAEFPYCVCNYYVPSFEFPEPGYYVYVCESTDQGQC